MASVIAEEAATVEGGESNFLKHDSKANAVSGGVDADAIGKFVQNFASFALAINDLQRDIANNKIEDQERVRNRRLIGILYPNENRDALVKQGKVPAYFSTSSIKDLLRREKLPYGWSENVAVRQGFGKEVSQALYKNKNRLQIQRLTNRLEDERNVRLQQQKTIDLQNRFKLHRTIDRLHNVVG